MFYALLRFSLPSPLSHDAIEGEFANILMCETPLKFVFLLKCHEVTEGLILTLF